MSRLTLDGNGRRIIGPRCGKAALLVAHGARPIGRPRRFPRRSGIQLVAVVIHPTFDAARWVQEVAEFERLKKAEIPIAWMEIPNDQLFRAERLEVRRRLLAVPDRPFADGWR